MRKRPLLWFACVFLCGLFFEKNRDYILLLVPCVFFLIEIYYGLGYKRYLILAGRSIILLSAFLLGIMHMKTEESFRARYMSELETKTEKEVLVTVWGEVVEIKDTDYGVRIRLSDCYVHLKEEMIPCNDVLVYASSDHFHVGEIHKITGKLNLFESSRNQGNFDSKKFYQSQKIDFSIQLKSSQILALNEKEGMKRLLLLKEEFQRVINTYMKERTAGFFQGLLLGDKSDLDEGIKDLFIIGGISHILAISGMHVSMIGRNIYQLLRKAGVRFAGAGIIAGMVLLAYGFLVGNGMSAIRAIGMMLIYFWGQFSGRSYDMLNALGAMVIGLLWSNPFLIDYSGFWFSVMALMGVGFAGEAFSNCLPGGIAVSLGITLTTLPVVAFNYFEIPLYSTIVNAIALPMLTPIFMLAICGVLLGTCIPLVAKVLFVPCEWGLEFYVWLCESVKKLPLSSIICGSPDKWVVILYYLILFVGILFLKKGMDAKNGMYNVLLICLLCIGLIIFPKKQPFEITFLDVGQGDAVYISTGENLSCFIDGGSTSEDSVGKYRILPFLKSKGIRNIDYWFVSHADMDHMSGVIEVLESDYKINYLVLSKYAPKDDNLIHLVSTAEQGEVEVLYMDAGDTIVADAASFTCLYPWDASETDKNDASLVLEFAIDEENTVRKALFAGDISSKIESLLLENKVIDEVYLYKASHHGSKYSNSSELLGVLQPEVCVVSCSSHNLYGHPHEEAVHRMESVGSEVFYTMENGQVSVLLLQ